MKPLRLRRRADLLQGRSLVRAEYHSRTERPSRRARTRNTPPKENHAPPAITIGNAASARPPFEIPIVAGANAPQNKPSPRISARASRGSGSGSSPPFGRAVPSSLTFRGSTHDGGV
jgi:hypothetical protein